MRSRPGRIAALCTVAVLTLTASTVASAEPGAAPRVDSRATARSFPDVPPTSPFVGAIDWLADAGVTGGYADGGFHPTDAITRQAMAAFLYRYDQATTSGADPGFTDVPPTHTFAEEIWWLADQGITGGYPDGGFRPGAPITRQAIAAFLYRYQGGQPGAPDPGFDDVPSAHPFAEEIWWLADQGITGGYPDGGFHPSDPITRQAMAAFLHRLAGEPAVGVPGVNRVDTEVAFVVDGDTATSNASNGDGTGILVLAAATTPAPVVGDIVVMDATDAIPTGAFGTVTAVTAGAGGISVEYGPATVEQVLPDADIQIAQELFTLDGGGAPWRSGGVFDLSGSDCDGSFTTNVTIDAGASLDFRANWGPSASERVLRLALNLNASATATANADLNVDCHMDIDLDSFIPPIPLPAVPLPGPLPPIQPTLEWTATLDATGGTDITFTGTAGFTGRYGAEYIDGKAGLINETTTDGSASLTATNPAGSAHAFVGPMVRFAYVGILNGSVEAGPFVEGEFDWLDGGSWTIRGGLEASAELGADLWLLGSYTWSSPRLTLWSKALASGGTPVAENEIMSTDGVGLPANTRVYLDGVSANGHRVLMHSSASNLPGGNGAVHYWLQDLDDGSSAPVMVPGLDHASTAITPILTAEGSEVIFQSTAGLAGGPLGIMAVYVLNIDDATVEWISQVPPGLIDGPLVGGASVIAADRAGRFVLFRVTENISPDCRALFSGGTDCYMPHYLRVDRWTGEVFDAWWGSETLPGYLGGVAYDDKSATIDHTGRYAVITGNYGHFIGYSASTAKYGASNFSVAYLLDMIDKEVFVISEQGLLVPADGQVVGGPHISDSGRHVVFASDATNLGIGDTNGATDIYRRDIFDDTWRRASIDPAGGQLLVSSTDPSISANGQLVTFQNAGTLGGLVPSGAYVRDVEAGATCEVAVGYNDTTPDAPIGRAIVTDEGFSIAFATDATNMVTTPVATPNAYRVRNRCL